MDRIREYIQWRRFSGEAVTVGDVTATPESQALLVRFPFGGFVWNRPVSVRVKDASGVSRVPVPDITRYVQWSLVAASAALTLSIWLLNQRKRA